MTVEQVITIRKYIDGAFPQVRQRSKEEIEDADTVWYDMLKDEDYHLTMQAVKNYIRSGNPFPPSISLILEGCKAVILKYNNQILEMMDADGYFDDPPETDAEIAHWNKDNRKRKAQAYVSVGYPKEKIPDWFKADYQRYEAEIKQSLIQGARVTSGEKAIIAPRQ